MVVKRATTLRRGLDVMVALGSDAAVEGGGLGVVRVAELVGQDKSQVSRALAALADCGLVERDADTRSYRLGWQLFALAARAGEPRLVSAATPVLARLVAELGETAHLSVLRGAEVLTLLSRASSCSIAATGWVGRMVPAHCTASGRALLIDHDHDALATLLGEAPFAPRTVSTPADVGDLARRILEARERGYAAVDEEFEPGLVAVAAAIRDGYGQVVAAVNVSGPKFRLGRRLASAGRRVRDVAHELSALLRADGPIRLTAGD